MMLTMSLEQRRSMNLAEIIAGCSKRSPLRSGAAG
jgi:hypothetical protein